MTLTEHLLHEAVNFGKDGLNVFPCIPTGDKAKAPLIQQGFKAATTDVAQIRNWWQQWPNAMIGVVIPDDVLVIDIDPRNGGSMDALEAVTGPLPATLSTVSGRGDGGKHLWFKKPAGELSARQLPQGVDLKPGGKGYVIAPPSLHPVTGQSYTWDNTAAGVAQLPEQAVTALQPPVQPRVMLPAPAPTGSTGDGLVKTVAEAVEGNRNNALYWATCRALDAGNTELVQDLFDAALSVGLTESEATATIASAERTPREQPEPFTPSRDLLPRVTPDANTSPEPEPVEDEPESSWEPLDLTAYVDGTYKAPKPSLMARTDGPALLYPAKVHSLSGESESGKSMVAIAEVSKQLTNGQPVLFLDYESDPATVVDRLLKMGTPKQSILDHFDYVLPEVDPVTATVHDIQQWQALLGNEYTLAVLDGVTEALGISGASSMDNDEVTHWIRKVPRAIADHTGAATLLIDHVTKSRDTRGRFAIGAQSKLSALSGAAYIVEPLAPLGVGLAGRLQIKVAKDRPGQVRPHSVGWDKTDRLAIIAEAVIDSTNPARIDYRLEPPTPPPTAADADAELKQRIITSIRALQKIAPPSWSKIRADVSGRDEKIKDALNELIAEGKVTVTTGSRNAQLHSVPE